MPPHPATYAEPMAPAPTAVPSTPRLSGPPWWILKLVAYGGAFVVGFVAFGSLVWIVAS